MRKLIILVLGCWLFTVSCSQKEGKDEKAPTRVKTEVLDLALPGDGQTYVGIVEEREATAVSFTTMGVVKRMLVNEGQMVSKGQLLAEIDPTSNNNSVVAAKETTNQARDMVTQARSTYNQAKDAYDRMKLLHDSGSLPEIKWIEAETRLRQAEAALQTAESGVRSATATENIMRKNLADTRLYAPVSGVIGRKQVGAGETAMPSQAVVTILDISSVKVKVAIPEVEMSSINPNTPSSIRVEAADKMVRGGRIEKGVVADALTHTYDVRINVPNVDRKLLPGMVASVTFDVEGGVLLKGKTMPVTAVQKAADGSLFVWTIDKDSLAHRTKVEVGPVIGNRIVIKQGVNFGQRFVTEGYQKLSEGSKVIFKR
jgi:RND family efflux transporter MFP subunit